MSVLGCWPRGDGSRLALKPPLTPLTSNPPTHTSTHTNSLLHWEDCFFYSGQSFLLFWTKSWQVCTRTCVFRAPLPTMQNHFSPSPMLINDICRKSGQAQMGFTQGVKHELVVGPINRTCPPLSNIFWITQILSVCSLTCLQAIPQDSVRALAQKLHKCVSLSLSMLILLVLRSWEMSPFIMG